MKTKTIIKGTLLIGILAVLSGCSTTSYNNISELNKVTNPICNTKIKNDSPWHISNLYDCKTKSWFIPYELWSGVTYTGDKSKSKHHQVNTSTQFSYREDKPNKMRTVDIKGALPWINAETGEHYKIYKRTAYKKHYNKNEYFTFRPYGIGRVFDNKGYQYGLTKSERYFSGSNIKFPAGYAWKLNTPVTKKGYVNGIERTTTVTLKSIELTDKSELESITFDWLLNDGKSETINFKYSRDNGIVHQYGRK